MTEETLQKAKEIEKIIKNLEDHRDSLTSNQEDRKGFQHLNPFQEGTGQGRPKVHVEKYYSSSTHELKPEFYPFPVSDFMALYLSKLDKGIHELKLELSSL